MALETNAPAQPQGELIDIGTMAARNLVAALELKGENVEKTVRDSIRMEIGAMSTHFALAHAELETAYEANVLRLRNEYKLAVVWLEQRKTSIIAVVSTTFLLGVLAGHFVKF